MDERTKVEKMKGEKGKDLQKNGKRNNRLSYCYLPHVCNNKITMKMQKIYQNICIYKKLVVSLSAKS